MPVLRLTETPLGKDQYRVEIALEGDGPRQTACAQFAFAVTEQDHRDLRWYLEDYLEHRHEPAPTQAACIERRIEQRMKQA